MTPRTRLVLLLPLLLFSLCTALLVQPMGASAATHPVHKAKAHFLWQKGHNHYAQTGHTSRVKKGKYIPQQGGTNLVYQGGPVMAGTTQVYVIFWEPAGSTVDPSYHDLLTRYFGDVGNSPLYQNNTQYADINGNAPQSSALVTTWVDTNTAYPANPMLDSDIHNEVQNAMAVNGWPPSIDNIFFVFLASSEVLCFDSSLTSCSGAGGQFCAYHSAFNLPGLNAPVIYAAMPYDGDVLANCYALDTSPNNDPASDAEISTTSHEQMEAATDPVPNTGWYDPIANEEIGDKCAYQYLQMNPDGSNVNWNGNPYIVQSEWDNAITGCALSGP
jgi:hypothetical protein